jgi:hypothetical protein
VRRYSRFIVSRTANEMYHSCLDPHYCSDLASYTSLDMQIKIHVLYEEDLWGTIFKVSWPDFSVSVLINLLIFIPRSEAGFSVAVHGLYLVYFRILYIYIFPILSLRNIQRQCNFSPSPSCSFFMFNAVEAVCYFVLSAAALQMSPRQFRWKDNSKYVLRAEL